MPSGLCARFGAPKLSGSMPPPPMDVQVGAETGEEEFGGEVSAFSETTHCVAPLRAFYAPFVDVSSGMAELGDCESPLPNLRGEPLYPERYLVRRFPGIKRALENGELDSVYRQPGPGHPVAGLTRVENNMVPLLRRIQPETILSRVASSATRGDLYGEKECAIHAHSKWSSRRFCPASEFFLHGCITLNSFFLVSRQRAFLFCIRNVVLGQFYPAALAQRVAESLRNLAHGSTQIGEAAGSVSQNLHISRRAPPQNSARGSVTRIDLDDPGVYSQFLAAAFRYALSRHCRRHHPAAPFYCDSKIGAWKWIPQQIREGAINPSWWLPGPIDKWGDAYAEVSRRIGCRISPSHFTPSAAAETLEYRGILRESRGDLRDWELPPTSPD